MDQKVFSINPQSPSLEKIYAKHHITSHILYLFFIGMVIVALGLMPIIKVDVSTQSRGIISSLQDNNPIRPKVYGEIKSIYLKENLLVCEGDTLLEIKTRDQDAKLGTNKEIINDNRRYKSDLYKLIRTDQFPSSRSFSTGLYLQENNRVAQAVAEMDMKLEFLTIELDRLKELYDAGAIARVEYEQKDHERNILLKNKKSFIEQQKKQWQTELMNYTLEEKSIQSKNKIINVEKNNYVLTAPTSGYISDYKDLRPGNYITPQDVIAQISASDSLIIENYVSTADIGYLYKGMDVHFQIDAFNYNQWGMATGTIQSISKDISIINDQPVFLVECLLNEQSLFLKNGYEGKLKKGMTITTRYLIAQRTLFDLLYDKVDDWLNPSQNIVQS